MSKTDDSDAKGEKGATEESEKDERKPAAGPAAREEEDEEEDEDDEDEAPAAPVKREPSRRSAAEAKTQPGRRGKRESSAPSSGGSTVPMSRVALFVVVAVAVGAAGGWFGQEAQAKARVKAESAAAPSGSGAAAGPCGAWQQKICDSGGATSAACAQAKGAVELLTASSCEAGLAMMPATLAKLKAARASCDSLVSKLCKDLPPGSPACTLVKDKTPAFPSQRCDEMLKHYDEVLGSLREIDQQGGPQMGAPGMGRPQMGAPGMGRPQMGTPSPH